jgi:hypothetical protein
MRRKFILLMLSLVVISNAACRSPRVNVGDTVPPEFSFDPGRFAECCDYFHVMMVLEEGSDQPLWKIEAARTVESSEAGSLVIHYGITPPRFTQEIPKSGAPPALIEGKTYEVVFGGAGYIPWPRAWFSIRDHKIVRLP